MENKENLVRFISDYKNKTEPLFKEIENLEVKRAAKISQETKSLTEKFFRLAAPGKKIRGALMVLAYKMLADKDEYNEAIYKASIFLELFHTSLLIHDDLIDDSDKRRGLTTIHKQYKEKNLGQALAICTGDLGFYFSWQLLLAEDFSPEKILATSRIFADYATRVAFGQILDVFNTSFDSRDDKKILKINQFKTAEYTGALPLLVGASLAGIKDRKKISLLEKFGLSLGWIFQIQDDILGAFGDEKITGKPVGSDFREGKATLLVNHLLKQGRTDDISLLREIAKTKESNYQLIERIQQRLIESGAVEYLKKLINRYAEEARRTVFLITSIRKYQQILNDLLDYSLERTV